MRTRITIAASLAVTAAITIAAVAAAAGDGPRAQRDGADLADVRRATAHYHDVARARRDGYVPIGDCTQEPGQGAMGIHYINPGLAADNIVDPLRPEMLLYEPQSNGRLRLVGVEWFVADADQDLSTDSDRPSALGHAFDGPMPGHEPGMPVHYDLHAWIWRHNPAGDFAIWNPAMRCE